ncbi:hypothetical protein A7P95_07870 [Eikenella longinqua]|uniref:Uncharacterized protein n=1 Tax=Eikenella longinqua TaxID=1795827 RepID=A0A1A9RVB0_9NEIS|nr:hypothetical protein [Eikenella longinqua]OAM26674.1 hypothetical protein A7P95_07870 [Eikenella longinqua]
MEEADYLAARREVREWSFGSTLLNGWATLFGAAALLSVISRILLLTRQHRVMWILLLLLLLLAAALGLAVRSWRRRARLGGKPQFLRLEEAGIRYCLAGAGEGFVGYDGLQFVNLRGGNFPTKMLLQYREPGQTGVLPQKITLDLGKIRPLPGQGSRLWRDSASEAMKVAEEIRRRCKPGQLYGKLVF